MIAPASADVRSPAPGAAPARVRTAEPDFAFALGAASSLAARAPREQQAREAAEEFVSVSLVQPILQELRSQNNAAAPFAPGDAERTFGALLDAEIARRIVRKADFPLVDEVARALLKHTPADPRTDARCAARIDANA